MPSQIEQIEASIAELEKGDPENPLLKSLKQKVAVLRAQQEKDEFNVSMRELLGTPWKL
ncbi:MAG: hypothetical protein HUJ31_09475 [Pseudomonadales bacterium]|nr:hypothetical protein [Pseudomonadales bacterium]